MKPTRSLPRLAAGLAALLGAAMHTPAQAEMVLSQVIVDMQPGKASHQDIEVWNAGEERLYVSAEPFEIQQPGQPGERRVASPDPTVSGLLVTPQRLVLEPDQRRLIRLSAIVPASANDRIYRITIKPVAGPVTAEVTVLMSFVWHSRWTWADRPAGSAGSMLVRLLRYQIVKAAAMLSSYLLMLTLVAGLRLAPEAANALAVAVVSLASFDLSDRLVFSA